MGTDFFDENNSAAGRDSAPPLDDSAAADGTLSDGSLTRLMRQKEQVMTQVAAATQEIEKLRYRQDALEKERSELQELCRRQEEYQKNKREIMEKLIQSLVMLEKEEAKASQMLELLGMMRASFKSALAEVKSIDEEKWPEDAFQDELNKATAMVEEARDVYRKGMAKLEASRWQKDGQAQPGSPSILGDELDGLSGGGRGFRHWFWTGTAFFLPLIITLVVLFLVMVSLRGY